MEKTQKSPSKQTSPQIKIEPIIPQAKLLFDYEASILGAIAGTGGGKTVLGYWWLFLRMDHYKGFGWGLAEPTYQMLSKIILNSPDPERPDILHWLDRMGMDPNYKAGEKIIETVNGKIYIGSADNPDSLQGAAVRGYWLDEAGMMSLLSFETAEQRVSMMNGQVLLTTTPYNRGWLKTEVADKADGKSIHVENWRSIDRPGFPVERYELMKSRWSKERFSMIFNGTFEKPEGLIYSDFDRMRHIVPDPFIGDRRPVRVVGGIDWGFNNPGCILLIALDNDGRKYVIHEIYETGKTLDNWIKFALSLQREFGVEKYYCDPSEPNNIEMMRRAGVYAVKGQNDVIPGINAVIEDLKTGNLLFVQDKAKYLIDEIEGYLWKEKEGSIKDEPVKENDHAVDTLRYTVMGIKNIVPFFAGRA
jgi:PBSX family phage terminase large subunit